MASETDRKSSQIHLPTLDNKLHLTIANRALELLRSVLTRELGIIKETEPTSPVVVDVLQEYIDTIPDIISHLTTGGKINGNSH